VISAEEEKRILAAAETDADPRIHLFIKIGLATSLRHSEILSARFDHLDIERRQLKVQVKGGRWRRQPLTRKIVELLAQERDQAADQAGWIFPSRTSKSGHLKSLKGPFARCIEAAGLKPAVVIPHTMRHTAITRLASTGADIKTIQEFSGHETLAMVMRYAHAQDQIVDAALDRLEDGTAVEQTARKDAAKA
jgi:integrase